jgi:hypothetical protein
MKRRERFMAALLRQTPDRVIQWKGSYLMRHFIDERTS